MGTPAYMSPEQCRGTREIDHRTDIYALGVILFEMVCGRPPFVSEGFGEMVHLHISAPPPSPRSINAAVPDDLERLITWCLAKEPAERVQTMTDVHAALTGRPTPQARPTATARVPAPTATPANPTTFTQAAQASALGTDVVPRSSGRRTPAIVMGVLAIGGVALWATRGSWMPRPSETVTVAPTTTVPAKADPATPPPPAPTKVPPSVTAAIVSDPPGARVVREDGAVIGMTPFRESWPGGDGVRKLRLELDGYRPEPVVVPLDRGVDLSFALRKVAQAEPHKPKDKHRDAKPAAAHPAAKVPAAPTPAPAPTPKAPPRSEPVPL